MENLYNRLYKLLNDELTDLSMGHAFNKARLRQMRELCHIIMYLKYVDINSTDIMQIFQFYDNL